MSDKQGRCMCGSVRFEYSGPENWCGHCHCESCRRNTSSPYTTFFGVPRNAYQFTGDAPSVYNSSPGVRRLFCGSCGSPIAYESDRFPNEIHFYPACMENPEDYQPTHHVFCKEKLSWVKLGDDLPKYQQGSDGPLID